MTDEKGKTIMEKEVTKMTRAEKTAAVKELFKILLEKKNYKRTELIDEAAKLYQERFPGEDTENVNDVKGRMGSVFTIMKEEGEMLVENGVCSLPKAKEAEKPIGEEKPEKPKAKTRKKADSKAEATQVKEAKEEKPKAKRAKKATKAEDSQVEEIKAEEPKEVTEEPTSAPALKKRGRKKAEPKAEEVKAETTEELTEETPVEEKPKKKTTRGRKKTEIKAEEPQVKVEETLKKTEEAVEVVNEETPEVKAEVSKNKELSQAEEVKPVEKKKEEKKKEAEASRVFDLSLLLGEKLSPKKGKNDKTETDEKPSEPIEKTREEKAEDFKQPSVAKKPEKEENEGGRVELKEQPKPEKPQEKNQEKTQTKAQEKPVQKPQEARKQEPKLAPAKSRNGRMLKVKQDRPLTADEALKEAYLKKLRSLGGDYFEYYSVYLLERYSLKNGRRLEALKISGGDHDGGIDGEIELTDKFGFRETIYIQAKNWNPEKGDERLWVVGETLLQQFIGACVCRQAKDNKRYCRGIFVTTSRFTPEAKRILDDMSDKIVGYDGSDLFDAAKECSFGLKQKDGVWGLDEDLLSGEKAFFNMF